MWESTNFPRFRSVRRFLQRSSEAHSAPNTLLKNLPTLLKNPGFVLGFAEATGTGAADGAGAALGGVAVGASSFACTGAEYTNGSLNL